MFDAVDGLLSLARNIGQAKPYQHGASNVIALDTRISTLGRLE
jgi:hypothetical protein